VEVARAAVGVNVAIVPAEFTVTAPGTTAPPYTLNVTVAGVSVIAFIALLNWTCTVVVVRTPVAPLAGVTGVTVGVAMDASPLVMKDDVYRALLVVPLRSDTPEILRV